MRRHDFDAGFIELVLNILVKVGVDLRHPTRLVGIRVDLVVNVEIIQSRLKYKRLGFWHDEFRGQRRLGEKPVNGSPRSVVPNGHRGVQNEARLLRRGAQDRAADGLRLVEGPEVGRLDIGADRGGLRRFAVGAGRSY